MATRKKKKPSARAKRLQTFLRSVGDRATDAAKRSEIPYTTIHSFLVGQTQEMTRPNEEAIAQSYNLTVDEIFGGSLPERAAQSPSPDAVMIGQDHYWPVPVYDIRASAGAGALVEDGDPTSFQVFRDQFITRISRAPLRKLAVIHVGGDSMWDTLHDGDSILVDRTSDRVVKDGIYVLLYEGELLVKRCQRDLETGAVLITSDNPRYKPMTVSQPRTLSVIGRVIWIGRSLG